MVVDVTAEASFNKLHHCEEQAHTQKRNVYSKKVVKSETKLDLPFMVPDPVYRFK
jgi:hypothetical protein